MNPMLGFAVKAARRAGDIINRAAENIEQLKIKHKTLNDLVSEVDHAAEVAIISSLQKVYPNHAFLAEESGRTGESDYEWIIDPLDGTTNFLHGFPVYGVSIALAYKKQLQVAVVYDPCRNDLYTAARGAGARGGAGGATTRGARRSRAGTLRGARRGRAGTLRGARRVGGGGGDADACGGDAGAAG